MHYMILVKAKIATTC